MISPGPGRPEQAGVSLAVIKEFGPRMPLLGVCLGHQCIGRLYGGEVVRADEVMHGKTSEITHSGLGVFAGLPSPLTATRYHSLVVRRDSVPDCLEITAEVADGWLPFIYYPEKAQEVWGDALARGAAKRSAELGPLQISAGGMVDTVARATAQHLSERLGQPVVIDNRTGEVLALVGSENFFAPAVGQVNGAWARRSAGSALKPFTYLLALEMGADAADIGLTIHPHPTLGESIGMAAEVAHGSCTDLPPAKK